MNAVVVYDSQYGNTERIARAIADELGGFGEVRAIFVHQARLDGLRSVDLFVIGCPTQGWRPTPAIPSLLEGISSEELHGPAFACFDTRFKLPRWMTGSSATVIAEKLQERGAQLLVPPESFFVKGMEGPLRTGELERASRWGRMLLKVVETPRRAAQRQS
ncbi:MAG TPA: flavodoxin domain-containing protein [Rubrobacter sp.]|nr:flavodoxin domain-containing protein [Rubrobacter sp.]